MKKITSLLCVAFLIIGIVFSSFQFGFAQSVNNVKGIINSDNTWSKTGSPYNLTGNVVINEGVTLKIEPGVTVYLNDYGIRVNGTFSARGTNTENINLIGGSIFFTASSASWEPKTGTGSIIENTVLKTSLSAPVTSVMIINNTITNYIKAGVGVGKYIDAGGNSTITKNVVLMPFYDYDTEPEYGVGVSGTAQVIDNIIYGAFKNTAVTIGRGSPTIQGNLISNSYGLGIGIFGDTGNPLIQENTLTHCHDGIMIGFGASALIAENNFENIEGYNLKMDSKKDINMSNNWWGTSDPAVIDRKIYDYYDDVNLNLGKVNYTPFLSSPNPYAPSVSSLPADNFSTPPAVSQNPSSTPFQPNNGWGLVFGLGWWQAAILGLLGVIAVLLVFVVVYLRRRGSMAAPR